MITDFSQVEEKDGIDDLKEIAATTITNSNKAVRSNLGIYRTLNGYYRTGRYCGITWLRNKDGAVIENNGEKAVLQIKPRFGLSIDGMISKISEDEEFMDYLCDDQCEGDRLFTFFFNEEMIEVDADKQLGGRIMVAISFIHSLFQESRRKIMRKIVRKEKNFTGKIKGKIIFNKQIQKNLVQGHEERIYCGYVEKTEDIFENQVLKYALTQAKEYLASEGIQNGQIIREIKACELRFANVSDIEDVDAEVIDSIRLPAMYSNFEQLLKLAYLVISAINMTSKQQNDSNKMVPFAVNMPLLFECYCRTLIKENIKDLPGVKMLKFVANKSGKYDEAEYGIKTIEGKYYISGKLVPDIVLKSANASYVLDVKYKKVEWNGNYSGIIIPSSDVRREDRLQLLAYNELYQPAFCGHVFPKSIYYKENEQNPIWWLRKSIDCTDRSIPYYFFQLKTNQLETNQAYDKNVINVKEAIQNNGRDNRRDNRRNN